MGTWARKFLYRSIQRVWSDFVAQEEVIEPLPQDLRNGRRVLHRSRAAPLAALLLKRERA